MSRENKFVNLLIDKIDQEIIRAYAAYSYECKLGKIDSLSLEKFKKRAITEIVFSLSKNKDYRGIGE